MSSLLIARVILLREVNGTVFRRGRLRRVCDGSAVYIVYIFFIDRVRVFSKPEKINWTWNRLVRTGDWRTKTTAFYTARGSQGESTDLFGNTMSYRRINRVVANVVADPMIEISGKTNVAVHQVHWPTRHAMKNMTRPLCERRRSTGLQEQVQCSHVDTACHCFYYAELWVGLIRRPL